MSVWKDCFAYRSNRDGYKGVRVEHGKTDPSNPLENSRFIPKGKYMTTFKGNGDIKSIKDMRSGDYFYLSDKCPEIQ